MSSLSSAGRGSPPEFFCFEFLFLEARYHSFRLQQYHPNLLAFSVSHPITQPPALFCLDGQHCCATACATATNPTTTPATTPRIDINDNNERQGQLRPSASEAVRCVLQVQPAVLGRGRLYGNGVNLLLLLLFRRKQRCRDQSVAVSRRPRVCRGQPCVFQSSDDHHNDGAAAGLQGVGCGPSLP